MSPRVAYVAGGWATNIGNAFYQLGNIHLLEQAFGPGSVSFVPDLNFWIWRLDGQPHLDLAHHVDADLYVFSGPILTDALLRYETLFDDIARRGRRIAFCSAGAQRYTAEEATLVTTFLRRYERSLAFVSTRDSATFELLSDLPCPVFDGICTSMFVGDVVTVPSFHGPPFAVFNFRRATEPRIAVDGDGSVSVRRRKLRHQTSVNDLTIVRTRSEQFTRDPDVSFDRPNTFASDVPHGYLALYGNAEVVFSERVHTCAATLALGGQAMYVITDERSKEGRKHLLARVGAHDVEERPVRLDPAALQAAKQEQVAFVTRMASSL